MKKLILFSLVILMITSCNKNKGPVGELVGVPDRKQFYEPDKAYGMVFIPMGSFIMGPK